MRAAISTCEGTPGDTAGYWVPRLYYRADDANRTVRYVEPRRIRVYYRNGGKDPTTIRAFPAGLKMIAGNGVATEYQPLSVTSFACTIVGGGRAGDELEVQRQPVCGPESPALRMKIIYPDCWDGVHLDVPDHKSHMTYSSRSRCPSTHPIPLPQITMGLRYWYGDNGLQRSSRVKFAARWSAKTYHGDFWNTWDQGNLEALVRECINAARNCGDTGGPR